MCLILFCMSLQLPRIYVIAFILCVMNVQLDKHVYIYVFNCWVWQKVLCTNKVKIKGNSVLFHCQYFLNKICVQVYFTNLLDIFLVHAFLSTWLVCFFRIRPQQSPFYRSRTNQFRTRIFPRYIAETILNLEQIYKYNMLYFIRRETTPRCILYRLQQLFIYILCQVKLPLTYWWNIRKKY